MTILSRVPLLDEPFDPVAFTDRSQPTDQDAPDIYQHAILLFERVEADYRIRNVPEPTSSEIDAAIASSDRPMSDELIRWLDANREALSAWQDGTEQSVATSGRAVDPVHLMRRFLSLATLAQIRCLREGQNADAWEWTLAGYRYCGHICQRHHSYLRDVGVILHSIFLRSVVRWAEHPQTSREMLQRALSDLRDADVLYPKLSDVVKRFYLEERELLLNGQWVDHERVRRRMTVANSYDVTPGARMWYWIRGEPELTIRLQRQVLWNLLPDIDKSLATRPTSIFGHRQILFDSPPRLSGQLAPGAIMSRIESSLLADRFLVPSASCSESYFRRCSRHAVVEVILALHTYHREKHQFPETLETLVPAYLETIPLDPCDPTSGPIRYRRDENSIATVWSIGPDGIDQSGDVMPQDGEHLDVGYTTKLVSD